MKLLRCLVLAGLVACGTPSAPDTSTTKVPVPPTATATTRLVAAAPATFLFDVPALLSLGLDQLTQQLGPAPKEDTPNESVNELERTYTKHRQKLVITYNTKTRQTETFFLPAPSPTETTRDCRQLLQAGNLRLNDPTYQVDSLAGEEAGTYLGIIVTKKRLAVSCCSSVRQDS